MADRRAADRQAADRERKGDGQAAGEKDKKHSHNYRRSTSAAIGDLQAGDRRQETCSYRRPTDRRQKTRNMHLKETYRKATKDKKHAATGDLQEGDRRQETCSYRRPAGR